MTKLNILQSIGLTEWLILALIVVLLFGGKKIPELFRGVAEAIKEFKKHTFFDPDCSYCLLFEILQGY